MSREFDVLRVGGGAIRYEVVRSRRRRRTLEIVVDVAHGVRVSVPHATPRAEIVAFVRRRAAWVVRQAAALTGVRRHGWADGERIPYLGRTVMLALVPVDGGAASASLEGGALRVGVPWTLGGEARRAAVREAVIAWYRERAEALLDARAARWEARLGLHARRLIVKEQRRRWGSCARDGTIRINWRLVIHPPRLIDYVIVHELCHLAARHHGPEFWDLVGATLPDYAERRAELEDGAARVAL